MNKWQPDKGNDDNDNDDNLSEWMNEFFFYKKNNTLWWWWWWGFIRCCSQKKIMIIVDFWFGFFSSLNHIWLITFYEIFFLGKKWTKFLPFSPQFESIIKVNLNLIFFCYRWNCDNFEIIWSNYKKDSIEAVSENFNWKW